MSQLTVERLRELLSFDAATGVFIRLVRRGPELAGEVAGGKSVGGYWRIMVEGRRYQAHRLAWFYANGVWPKACIDHINGNRTDNRMSNLREATTAQNMQNQDSRKTNTISGLTGVYQHGKNWRARVFVEGRGVGLGTYPTLEEAANAYAAGKARLHTFQPVARDAAPESHRIT